MQPGRGLLVAPLALQGAPRHQMGVGLDRVALDDFTQLFLGAAQLRRVVVGAGRQQPWGALSGDFLDVAGEQAGRLGVVLGLEGQPGTLPALGGGLLAVRTVPAVEEMQGGCPAICGGLSVGPVVVEVVGNESSSPGAVCGIRPAVSKPSRPLSKSSIACLISSWVFITNGPQWATGSRIGRPSRMSTSRLGIWLSGCAVAAPSAPRRARGRPGCARRGGPVRHRTCRFQTGRTPAGQPQRALFGCRDLVRAVGRGVAVTTPPWCPCSLTPAGARPVAGRTG